MPSGPLASTVAGRSPRRGSSRNSSWSCRRPLLRAASPAARGEPEQRDHGDRIGMAPPAPPRSRAPRDRRARGCPRARPPCPAWPAMPSRVGRAAPDAADEQCRTLVAPPGVSRKPPIRRSAPTASPISSCISRAPSSLRRLAVIAQPGRQLDHHRIERRRPVPAAGTARSAPPRRPPGHMGSTAAARPRRHSSQVRAPDIVPSKRRCRKWITRAGSARSRRAARSDSTSG